MPGRKGLYPTRVDVEIATWRGSVVVIEVTVGEESGVGNGRDDRHGGKCHA